MNLPFDCKISENCPVVKCGTCGRIVPMPPMGYNGRGCVQRREVRAKHRLEGFALGLAIGAGIIFALWARPSRAEPVAGPIRVIDGDTVELLRSGEIIRLYNIDAPEARPCAGGTHGGATSSCARCPAEMALAARAGERLAAMLEGQPVAIHRCEPSGRCKDRYGRTLARLEAAGRDVGEALINEGLATRWPERGNWCGRNG